MALDIFYLKVGNRLPELERVLLDEAGNPLDLSSVLAVLIRMAANHSPTLKIANAPCTIVEPRTLGKIRYPWAAADVDTKGRWLAEFDLDYGGGRILTVPNRNFLIVEIGEKLPIAA